MIFATGFWLRRLVGCPRGRLRRGSGSGSTAIAWIASARQGQVSAAKQGRPGGSRLDDHEAFIIGMIEAPTDITLNEMVLRLEEDRSGDCQEFCAVGRFHQLKNRSQKMRRAVSLPRAIPAAPVLLDRVVNNEI
ncbi:hypothetical protein CDO26_36740 (plasmid) [Sinorhizobium meliloti]|nr:hypothetical protein CDO26_36740 [Sinorhizobium meliloti]